MTPPCPLPPAPCPRAAPCSQLSDRPVTQCPDGAAGCGTGAATWLRGGQAVRALPGGERGGRWCRRKHMLCRPAVRSERELPSGLGRADALIALNISPLHSNAIALSAPHTRSIDPRPAGCCAAQSHQASCRARGVIAGWHKCRRRDSHALRRRGIEAGQSMGLLTWCGLGWRQRADVRPWFFMSRRGKARSHKPWGSCLGFYSYRGPSA